MSLTPMSRPDHGGLCSGLSIKGSYCSPRNLKNNPKLKASWQPPSATTFKQQPRILHPTKLKPDPQPATRNLEQSSFRRRPAKIGSMNSRTFAIVAGHSAKDEQKWGRGGKGFFWLLRSILGIAGMKQTCGEH